MSEPAVISAVYTEWKMVKTRGALILCFEVPLEQQAIVQAVLGTPLPDQSTHVAIVRLVNGAVPTLSAPAEVEPPAKRGKLAQQAGILCNEPAFRRFLAEREGSGQFLMLDLDMAADYLRARCGVESRADLDRDEEAARKFNDLRGDYKLWLSGGAA